MAHSTLDLSVRPTILTVPGLGNSGPSHWQTLWNVTAPTSPASNSACGTARTAMPGS
ncbi:alpha/beta hydrolase [Sphingomonas sp. MMS24-JH45]